MACVEKTPRVSCQNMYRSSFAVSHALSPIGQCLPLRLFSSLRILLASSRSDGILQRAVLCVMPGPLVSPFPHRADFDRFFFARVASCPTETNKLLPRELWHAHGVTRLFGWTDLQDRLGGEFRDHNIVALEHEILRFADGGLVAGLHSNMALWTAARRWRGFGDEMVPFGDNKHNPLRPSRAVIALEQVGLHVYIRSCLSVLYMLHAWDLIGLISLTAIPHRCTYTRSRLHRRAWPSRAGV